MRIRVGNDFVFLWSIERNGRPENLSECLEIKLTLKSFWREEEIDFEIVNDNIIRIEVTPEMAIVTGLYSLVLKYILADESLSDNDRKCAVDTKAFTIVANTAEADDISEIAVTSDMLIGLKGDAFTYDDFTEEQLADLRQPAIDAGLIAEQQGNIAEQQGNTAATNANTAASEANTAKEGVLDAISEANTATIAATSAALNANNKAALAETAAANATDAETAAASAANNADSKATMAYNAATNADTKAALAAEKATLADTKATLADTAARNANEAANSIGYNWTKEW